MLQPIYRTNNGQLYAVEILVRLPDSHGNLILPDEFLPVAREQGMLLEITLSILETVAKNFSKLPDPEKIAINFPPILLSDAASADTLISALKTLPIHPRQLIIEITEDGVYEVNRLIQTTRTLSHLGYIIALDDFGIGDSSLARTAMLPSDLIKISRSLLQDSNERTQVVLRSAIRLAKRLNTTVVVEGAETEIQFELARVFGADAVQGFWLSPLYSIEQWQDIPKQFALPKTEV